MGWECPVCKSVWAPSVLRCQNNHGGMGAPVPVQPWWPVRPGTTTIATNGPVQVYGIADLPAGYTMNARGTA